ncbi:MAG: nitroreductase family protein [Eubacteriaceae bacterium]|nr:nitroreductase family protein [Eubacteriaceae bacterium]
MIRNEVIDTIMEKRRSYKFFNGDPINDDILETILACGQIAPSGMNRQSWHFTVIKSPEGMAELGKDLMDNFEKHYEPLPAEPGGTAPPPHPFANMTPIERTRNAPVMIIVSGDTNEMCSHIDASLAMENMLLAAASMGLGTGWDFYVNKDFFGGPDGEALMEKYKIPEGYKAYCSCYFGYNIPAERDRGPRKEGTISFI